MHSRKQLLWISTLIATIYCGLADAAKTAAIYKCEIDGVPTFSDRPCGGAANLAQLDLGKINIHEAQARPEPTVERPPAPKRKPAARIDATKRAETCARLAQSLKEVHAKLRSGYSAKERGRLKDREAKLKSELRLAQCG
jgi:hypothetical protein